MDQFPCFLGQTFPAFDVQLLVAQQALVQGQHEQASLQRAPDCREAGRRDLLEDRHQKAERLPLAALSAREVEAVLQVLAQFLVEQPLLEGHQEGFGMNPSPCKERRAVRLACVGLGAAKHNRVQAVTVLQHFFRTAKQRRIEQLRQHPELKVVSLVRRGGQQHQVT